MNAILPWFFVALATTGLVFGVFLFWQSLRYAVGSANIEAYDASMVLQNRQALLARKAALLREIRDLEFEHAAGKLSDIDFDALDRELRTQAKNVLQTLDTGAATFTEAAEELIAQHANRRSVAPPTGPEQTQEAQRPSANSIVCPECTETNIGDDGFCQSCGARIAPIACVKCRVINDPDATFCKKCGAQLGSSDA